MSASENHQRPKILGLAFTIAVSIAIGLIPVALMANSSSGYAAGFIALPLLFVELVLCVTLFAGVVVLSVCRKYTAALYLLIAVILVPLTSLTGGATANYLEIGAYRTEPMTPIIPSVANKIIFREGVTSDQTQEFWHTVLSTPHPGGGHMSQPGIQSISTAANEQGHEVILFSYFESATEEQKLSVRQKIWSTPIVLEFKEGVDTDYIDEASPPASSQPAKTKEAVLQ